MTPDVRWPRGLENRFDFGLLCLLIVFYVVKAVLMWRRSVFVDRLGASMIAANVAIGCAFAATAVWTLVPAWYRVEAVRWPIRLAVTTTAGWALLEMWRAKPARVRRAVEGDGDA